MVKEEEWGEREGKKKGESGFVLCQGSETRKETRGKREPRGTSGAALP